MCDEEVLKCHFLPLSSLKRVASYLDSPSIRHDKRCKRNLVQLQTDNSLHVTELRSKKWRNAYQIAIGRAIYSHDWNKLAYLLKKSPIWEHASNRSDELAIYIRALTILLMYHPSAKSQLLLNDYLHMVHSCRSDEDKKAVYKVLLSLTDRIYGR